MTGRLPHLLKVLLVVSLMATAGSVLAEDRFVDNGDGTVTDLERGLMWAQTDNHGNIDWKQADRWVRFTFPDTIEARHGDWRLPTLDELKSLYVADNPDYDGYETACGQVVRVTPAIRLTCGWVWAADTQAITAAVFNFHRGVHYTERMAHYRGHRALAVRSIK
ncbi:MAG: DUF1566 domain-containing protein [Desulfobacterales bacterium]|nr:DUF1566 domain-containing protein [Desulfobacterales bacterium]